MSFIVKPALYDVSSPSLVTHSRIAPSLTPPLSRRPAQRLMAPPGAKAYCKLSVITSALCERLPGAARYTLGPDGDIPLSLVRKHEKEKRNRDLAAEEEEEGAELVVRGLKPRRQKRKPKVPVPVDYPAGQTPAPAPTPEGEGPATDPILSTEPDLWYPKPRRNASELRAPARPGMMLLTLTPRPDPQITPEDKDVWDYVLRRMFVNPGSALAYSIK